MLLLLLLLQEGYWKELELELVLRVCGAGMMRLG